MKKILFVLFASLAATILADVSVEDVKCVQRYPWNGLVDIEYTIACDDPDAEIYVNPVGFNGDTGLTVFPTHFTGDGATNTVKAGKHTMVWDAKADMGLFVSKNFQIKMYAGKTLAPYVVVDLSSGPDGDSFPIRYSIAGPDLADDTCRTAELWLRLIPPGTFMMGSPADELGRSDNEDLHKVGITEPFYIGVFEVTQEQWYRIKGVHGGMVIIQETRLILYYMLNIPVQNTYGIYDMHGNVCELCLDMWQEHLGTGSCVDPIISGISGYVVAKGGHWQVGAGMCRSASTTCIGQRSRTSPLGFRVSCPGNHQK